MNINIHLRTSHTLKHSLSWCCENAFVHILELQISKVI